MAKNAAPRRIIPPLWAHHASGASARATPIGPRRTPGLENKKWANMSVVFVFDNCFLVCGALKGLRGRIGSRTA